MKMMMMRTLTSNYWKWKGFVPEVTWGLNLMLGDAPAKGSVQKILTHLSDPFTIFYYYEY